MVLRSGQEGEPLREFQQLEHFVNVHVDGSTLGQVSQPLHRSDHIRIDPKNRREIQSHFTLRAVYLVHGFLLQGMEDALRVNFDPLRMGCHTDDHSLAVACSFRLARLAGLRPRYALQNNSTNSLTNGMRGLERHEGSSKATLAKSGMARSNSSWEIPRSAMERGISSRSSSCSVADTRLFTFSATVSPARPSKSAIMAYFLCAIYPCWFGDGMNLVGTDALYAITWGSMRAFARPCPTPNRAPKA